MSQSCTGREFRQELPDGSVQNKAAIVAIGEDKEQKTKIARGILKPILRIKHYELTTLKREKEIPVTGRARSKRRRLRAKVRRVNGQLRVLAENDIEKLKELHENLLELKRKYANVQTQLVLTNRKLQQREAEIVEISQTDPLTGIGNRRRLDQALATEISRCDRTGEQLSAMMADLDHFKRINDRYGHEAGDKILIAFGELLRQHTRTTDVVTRFGGEEFVVLLPHTDREHALAMAERIRRAFAARRIEPLRDPVTVSFGVAELLPGERAEGLLRGIDKALYKAKQGGRNRVVAG